MTRSVMTSGVATRASAATAGVSPRTNRPLVVRARLSTGFLSTDMSPSTGSGEQATLATFETDEQPPESDVEALEKRVDTLEDALETTVDSVTNVLDRVEALAERDLARSDADHDTDGSAHRPPEHTDVRGYN